MPAPKQQDITIEQLNQLVWEHLEARDWHENPPRGLAISLVLEASELLEHYQWRETSIGTREDVGEELADVLIYAMQIAQREGIDIADAMKHKLEKSALKYPADQFKGKDSKAKRAAWIKAKLEHKKTGL